MRALLSRSAPLLVLATAALVGCSDSGTDVQVTPTDSPPPPPPPATNFTEASGTWVEVAPLPVAVQGIGAAVYRGDLYVSGGSSNDEDPAARLKADAFRYDVTTDTWIPIGDLPQPRFRHQMVVTGDTLYAVGGQRQRDRFMSTVAAYDPTGEVWENRSETPENRVSPSFIGLDDSFLMISGQRVDATGDPIAPDPGLTHRYVPGAGWGTTPANAPTVPRWNAYLHRLGGQIMMIGGTRVTRVFEPSAPAVGTIEVFSPGSGTWSTSGQLPFTVHSIQASLAGRVHFIGAVDFGEGSGSLERPDLSSAHVAWEPSTDRWFRYPPAPWAVDDATILAFDGDLYVLGGQNESGRVADVWRFTPE